MKQPALSTYKKAPWLTTASSCNAILLRAAVNGATTSDTGHPRSELREMTADGSATTSWSSTAGTHTMVVDEAITHLPKTKPHVMAGQIHDESSDVTSFRLEGSKLYVTSYNTTHYKLVTSNYQLGDRFQGKFVAHSGKVDVYYDGNLQASVNAAFGSGYFKAGALRRGHVTLYGVTVTHS
ncbi:polysaccharide lyase family 7 protein [Streptomyces sp. NPDC048415]|uniref:polysaccharide lyase family 7 protein n=1 Tax=Streptomyces sp. NPDC048415 TaxID=3154822 RepID=UPI00342E20EE